MSQSEPVVGEVIDASTITPNALELITKAEVDVQITTAKKYPRSLETFKKRGIDMATIDPQTAESCIYSRPVGKGEDGKQKYAEGMSIRMAEIVAASYGNLRAGARIIEQTDRFVKCQGVCHDLETNNCQSSEAMESTVKRNGQPFDERMRVVVAKACLAKAKRDAIFSVVPRALAKPIEIAVRKVIAGDEKSIGERRENAKKWVDAKKIEHVRVFAALGVQGWEDVGADQLVELLGIKTAIVDGEITIDEAFPPLSDPAAENPKPGAGTFSRTTKSATGSSAEANKGASKEQAASTTGKPGPDQEKVPSASSDPTPGPAPADDKGIAEDLDADALRGKIVEVWHKAAGGERTMAQCEASVRMFFRLGMGKKAVEFDTATADVLRAAVEKIESGKVKLASYVKD